MAHLGERSRFYILVDWQILRWMTLYRSISTIGLAKNDPWCRMGAVKCTIVIPWPATAYIHAWITLQTIRQIIKSLPWKQHPRGSKWPSAHVGYFLTGWSLMFKLDPSLFPNPNVVVTVPGSLGTIKYDPWYSGSFSQTLQRCQVGRRYGFHRCNVLECWQHLVHLFFIRCARFWIVSHADETSAPVVARSWSNAQRESSLYFLDHQRFWDPICVSLFVNMQYAEILIFTGVFFYFVLTALMNLALTSSLK